MVLSEVHLAGPPEKFRRGVKSVPRSWSGLRAVAVAACIGMAVSACSSSNTTSPSTAGASGAAGTPASNAANPGSASYTTGTPKTGGTLKVALASIPPTIDPYATSLQAAWTTARQVCEPLFDISAAYEVAPMLVDTYTYDKKLTYTFKLRAGVSFQNGAPLTAADVVASIGRFILTPGQGASLGTNLASVTAKDALTVVLTLKAPSAAVPTLLTTAYIMPASLVKNRPITNPIANLVCTGPYKLISYQPDQEIKLQRWSGYKSRTEPSSGATGAKHAYVDEIDLVPVPDASSRLQSVITGEDDIGASLPLDDYQQLTSTTTAVAALSSPNSASTVVFNKAHGVMSNVRMRQAFQAALDETQIMAAGFGNPAFYSLDGSWIPQVNKTWYTTSGTENYNKPDLAKVKSLLTAAGYTGQPITWITTKDDPTWYAPAVPAQQLLKQAGVNINLVVLDQASLIARRKDVTQFDLFSSGIPTYADPLLLPYLQDAFPGLWTNPQKDQLLSELATEPDQTARKAIWDKLQALIYTDVPFLKFGTFRVLNALSSRTHVKNPDDLAAEFYNVWLDQ